MITGLILVGIEVIFVFSFAYWIYTMKNSNTLYITKHMKVKDLILTYSKKELKIAIRDKNDHYLIQVMWKSDYTDKKYFCKSFHQYDDVEVISWKIEIDGGLYITI